MSDDQDDLIARIHDHLQQGDVDAARKALQELEKAAPDARDSLLARAAVESYEDPDAAMATIELTSEKFADDPVVLTVQAGYFIELHGDVESALPLLEQAVALLEDVDDEEGAALRSEARALLAEVMLSFSDPHAARDIAKSAVDDDDDNILAHLALASALFALCDLDASAIEAALVDELPEGHHLLGRIAAARGDLKSADAMFARAAEMAPDRFFVPVRTDAKRFVELVEEAKQALEPDLADVLADLAINVTERPDLDQFREQDTPLPPDTPAVAELGEDTEADGTEVTTLESILLFQENLEVLAADEEELVSVIAEAIFDQLIDVLGLEDEDEAEEQA